MKRRVPTVFVVDDDSAVRGSLRILLRANHLAVEVFASAREFLGAYSTDRPGCLVLDLCMPEMDGLQLQQALVRKGCQIPVVFISGRSAIPETVRALKSGAVDFLRKPLITEDLLARDEENRRREAEKAEIVSRMGRLTPREYEVLAAVINGKSSKEIARELNLSYRTIEIHRSRIMAKMEAGSVLELFVMTVFSGLSNLTFGSCLPAKPETMAVAPIGARLNRAVD